MSQPNVRIRRTRKLLREALVELIEERGFDRVTVAEITSRALVSRAAFYRNYRDKYHLVEQIFDEAMAELRGTIGDEARPSGERWVGFIEHVDAYHRLYGALLGRRGSPWFADRMRTALAAMTTEHFPDGDPDAFMPGVLSAIFVQTITWWLEHERPVPPREIAVRSARLAAAVIAAGTTADAPAPVPANEPSQGPRAT